MGPCSKPDCVKVKIGLDSSEAGRPRWVTLHSLLRADLGQNPKEVASSFQQPSDQAESPARPSPGLGSLLSSPYPPLTREHPRKWPVGGGRSGRGCSPWGVGAGRREEGRPGSDWLGYARQLPAKNKREQAAGVLGVGAPTRRAPAALLREDAPTTKPAQRACEPGGARGFSARAGRAPRN